MNNAETSLLLKDFLAVVHAEVRERLDLQNIASAGATQFDELAFVEIFAGYMAERGITFAPQPCRFVATVDGQPVRLSGFALSDELDRLDLLVTVYAGETEPRTMPEEMAHEAAEHCGRFLALSASGTLGERVDRSHDAFPLISTIAAAWSEMQHVRIHVLTDLCAGALHVPELAVLGRSVPVEVFDIERVFDQRQDAELQHQFRALNFFRDDWIASISEAATDEGEIEATAFVDDTGRRLVDAEEFSDFQRCGFARSVPGYGAMQVDGYAFDDADGSLALLIADFCGAPDMPPIAAEKARRLFDLAERYAAAALAGELSRDGNPSGDPGIGLAADIVRQQTGISRLRLYLVTDRLADFAGYAIDSRVLAGIPVERHVWDVARFHRAWVSDSGRDDLEVDFKNGSGNGIAALHAGSSDEYEGYLCTVSGAMLASIYERHGSRLLEGNVRSFLSTKGKINSGIQQTIAERPAMFFAYNNGVAATAESVEFDEDSSRIIRVVNLQIVNGGQTTASLAAASRQGHDLSKVWVQMKLSVLPSARTAELIPLIARFANSQNKVNESDFFANHPYHLRLEQLSKQVLAPAFAGGVPTRWYYERSRGQYVNDQKNLSREAGKEFLLRNPKSQLLTKLDVAKLENTWKGLPHQVSKGAQKNFVIFAGWLAKRWTENDSAFDEQYFRDLVAMAIMFRQTELIVKAQPWFEGAYRANIVTYTLAVLQFSVLKNGKGRQLDLGEIWEHQRISQPLCDQIAKCARAVFGVLTDPHRPRANVTEWAKQEACWERVRDAAAPLSQEVVDGLFDPVSRKYASGAGVQQVGYGVFARTAVLGIRPGQWQAMLDWGTAQGLLDAREVRLLRTACRIPKFVPSVKECEQIWSIRSRLVREGFAEIQLG
ncbi:AIPR family protein [Massilia sp. CFBP9026]|uniref:AIPR family protein n=1 Tax=Massilia sp. CFBP9026 TaxID=3096536 RepID=UPI002A69F2A6|nr:AIPR family protein [Massilia sp. CFBP9026]MDY0963952.1 AIPR family protein [Massilia sp. CFBP9026]